MEKNYYEVLGVCKSASAEEIEEAYLKNIGNFQTGKERLPFFKAYVVLINSESRKEYNFRLNREKELQLVFKKDELTNNLAKIEKEYKKLDKELVSEEIFTRDLKTEVKLDKILLNDEHVKVICLLDNLKNDISISLDTKMKKTNKGVFSKIFKKKSNKKFENYYQQKNNIINTINLILDLINKEKLDLNQNSYSTDTLKNAINQTCILINLTSNKKFKQQSIDIFDCLISVSNLSSELKIKIFKNEETIEYWLQEILKLESIVQTKLDEKEALKNKILELDSQLDSLTIDDIETTKKINETEKTKKKI
ncbi:MAG: J domain-containing protein [Bacilli bacterium]